MTTDMTAATIDDAMRQAQERITPHLRAIADIVRAIPTPCVGECYLKQVTDDTRGHCRDLHHCTARNSNIGGLSDDLFGGDAEGHDGLIDPSHVLCDLATRY